jgi:hypothetical protein
LRLYVLYILHSMQHSGCHCFLHQLNYCQGPNPCQGHMIGRGPTSSGTRPLPRPHDQPRPGFRVHVQPLPNAHKTLYFLCSLSPFLFPSPVLRYSFNSLSIGMRLSSLTLSQYLNLTTEDFFLIRNIENLKSGTKPGTRNP